jgi:hypothetical protein
VVDKEGDGCYLRMEDGGWRMEDGGWRIEQGSRGLQNDHVVVTIP